MARSNAENRDAAIHQLLDLMQIPGENRPAAASELLQLIKQYEELSQYDPAREKKRSQRISKLREDLRREEEGRLSVTVLVPWQRCDRILKLPAFKRNETSWSRHPETIWSRRLETIMPSTRVRRPANRPLGSVKNIRLYWMMVDLYGVQKSHGEKLLTLTNNSILGRVTGSLPAALRILHRIVPSIVPSRNRYPTLYRYRCMALDELGIRTKRRRQQR